MIKPLESLKSLALDTPTRLVVAWQATALLFVLVLAGCGGGVGSGGTGTYAAGPITGFGSVIVNDVRFDDTTASVVDDDDAARTRSELKLGMTVVIDSDAIRTETTGRAATASHIRFGSEIVGPVTAVDTTAGTLSVLGQTVRVAADTVFDERLVGGLAGVEVASVVEVYGLYDAANARFDATRIEPVAAAAAWRLRGPVSSLDTAARTFHIGLATFTYAGASTVPADLANGRIVRLRVATALDGSGRLVVTSFGLGVRPPEDRDEAELKGLITRFTSSASFDVSGLPVDASAAAFPDGTSGLRVGARVEVKGSAVAGVIKAKEVSIETEEQVRDQDFELKGAITAVDVAAKTFTLRGQTVSWARPGLELEGGTLADLQVGRNVEVKAKPSPDRTRLDATKIEFE